MIYVKKGFFRIVFLIILITAACTNGIKTTKPFHANFSSRDSVGKLELNTNLNDLPVKMFTCLDGCRSISEVHMKRLINGVELSKTVQDSSGNQCVVVDRFIENNDTIIWEVEIHGKGAPWTFPIETVVEYSSTVNSTFWTSWTAMEKNAKVWQDPFCVKPFDDLELIYGGQDILDPNSMVIPLFSIFEGDKGFTLSQSPKDTLLDMKLITSKEGKIVFRRENHKISSGNIVRFAMDIISHPADWRAGINYYVRKYPEYFEPKSKEVHKVAGSGAYSSWEGEIDVEKYKKMAFSFNWKASLDFPYMGMFLPPVSDITERWEKFHQRGVKVGDGFTSILEMENYMKYMKREGFNVLCYFNLTEFGNLITYPPPLRKARDENNLWKDANDMVYYSDVNKALLKVYGSTNDSPVYSNWEGCVVVDPGEDSYKNHLLSQAARHIELLPSGAGICIDRLDWLRQYNIKGNDGVSWKNNVPSRSLLFSWKEVMNQVGQMMHNAGKVIFANVLNARIDILEQIDAIYDEYGQIPLSLNRSAMMTFRKPLVAWTASVNDFKPDPDTYIQRHLYLGAFLTVPFPGNDHTILPDPEIEKYYLDYGDMFSQLKGKRWLLEPGVLNLEEGDAKLNIFETDSTYVIPAVFGKNDNVIVSVNLKNIDVSNDNSVIIYPGTMRSQAQAYKKNDKLFFDLPMIRGCAMLVLKKIKN